MERWTEGKMLGEVQGGGELPLAGLERLAGALVEVADTGTAGDLVEVRHNLGRVPRGLVIVNSVATDFVQWGREADDPDWTVAVLSARFSVDHARVLLWIF